MKISQFLQKTAVLLGVVFLCHVALATTSEHGPSPEIVPEQTPPLVEIGRLRSHHVANGEIAGSRDGGLTWELIGRVEQPTLKVNPKGYNASRYAAIGSVAATAVNAIHIKAGFNTKENKGIIWSLSPASETEAGRNSLQSEVSPGASAFTTIPGGSGIFGGPFTPFVGNMVYLDNDRNNDLKPIPENYVPKLGDVWTIRIERPRHYPREIIFENRFGGLITIQYRDEKPRVIGQVLRPVQGVGRFVGSYFSEVGRLRANHNGVIDISTSPRGKIGSFQIVPANHAMSPETNYIRELTQWMVIGPVSALDPSWEGTAPLYSQFLRPRYDRNDVWNNDWIEGLAGRFYFDVKLRDKNNTVSDWQPMPNLSMEPNKPLPSKAGTALANMTHLRIVFPFAWNTPTETVNTTTASAVANSPVINSAIADTTSELLTA
ncbi:MAG TPA: hypothetical protein VF719_10420, partial [Abditibacteriaceae bacterium]